MPVGVEVWLDGQQILNKDYVTKPIDVDCCVSTSAQTHVLTYIMKNKTPLHTRIDSNNNIVKDSCLAISNLIIDGFEVSQQLEQFSIYTHNHNGTSNSVQGRFYKIMGCNGTVKLNFCVPIYQWLVDTYTEII